jgi:hypothetical protein
MNYLDDEMPSYKEVIGYYLRDDVSAFLWTLSQTRQLKFFHHCTSDLRITREVPDAISTHCVSSLNTFKRQIIEASIDMPAYPYAFFPFWGMQSTKVNTPGNPDDTVGWDARFEFDFEQDQSFAVVLPIAGVLQYFSVPHLLKFSGHRSLHLVIPAESFPAKMKQKPDHREWMRVFDQLGDFFCRLAPYVNPTNTKLAKETVLTTPYSFHRYNGLINLPISIGQALTFKRGIANLSRFPGVSWGFPDASEDGAGLKRLLGFAEETRHNAEIVVDTFPAIFKDSGWQAFFQRAFPSDNPQSVHTILMKGVCGFRSEVEVPVNGHTDQNRLRKALTAMDLPENKTIQHLRLIADFGFDLDFNILVRQRRNNALVLADWIDGGVESALKRILMLKNDSEYAAPFLLALRLLTILPETRDVISSELKVRWRIPANHDSNLRLFLLLAIAQCTGKVPIVAPHLTRSQVDFFMHILEAERIWPVDSNPERTVAALCLAYGPSSILSWISNPEDSEALFVISNVFAGNIKKLIFPARNLLAGMPSQ